METPLPHIATSEQIDLDPAKRHLFVSPHLDDAPLSCGGFISRLTEAQCSVRVVTLFTADSSAPLSAFAQRFHRSWNLGSHPYEQRRNEDEAAMAYLGTDFFHCGLVEAIYRCDPNQQPLYNSVSQLFELIDNRDDAVVGQVADQIARQVSLFAPTHIYCPMGLGRHADHQAVIKATQLLRDRLMLQLWLYEEFPYATGRFPPERPSTADEALTEFGWSPATSFVVPIDVERRIGAARCYPSQMAELFSDDATMCELQRKYASEIGNRGPAERFWYPAVGQAFARTVA